MRLEIDAGNTLVKWRVLDKDENVIRRNAFNTTIDIEKWLSTEKFAGSISSVLISNVSGLAIEKIIGNSLAITLEPNCIFVAKSSPVMRGVTFSYDDIGRLGVDRCLAMVAAYDGLSEGVLVIDCGSAITADFVSDAGSHLGGYILPGIGLLKESLLNGTAKVDVEMQVNSNFSPGNSTEACVENGIHLMIRSTLAGLRSIALEFGISRIVLTGGDGQRVISMSDLELEYHRDLVFDGLSLLNPY